ncbi:MAG: hypothetical protein WBX81_13800, partial [Nitrososphaeraceae archaeon]
QETIWIGLKPFLFQEMFPWVKTFVKPHNILSISNLDSMLADASFILTNIANSISNLTMKIQDPFSSLEESPRPFTILDGWEGITRELDSAARTKAEKMLTSIINRSEGFIVFLVEEIDKSSIEYLVDGVIVLNQNFYRSYSNRGFAIDSTQNFKDLRGGQSGTGDEQTLIVWTTYGMSLSDIVTNLQEFTLELPYS